MENRELLKSLADNPALMQLLRELLEKHFSVDNLEATESDIILGQLVRARLVGLKAVEDAMKEIAQCKSIPASVDKLNPGK